MVRPTAEQFENKGRWELELEHHGDLPARTPRRSRAPGRIPPQIPVGARTARNTNRHRGGRTPRQHRGPVPHSARVGPAGETGPGNCGRPGWNRQPAPPCTTNLLTTTDFWGQCRLTPRHRRRCRKPECRASADSWRQLAAGASLTIPGAKAGGYGVSCPVSRCCPVPQQPPCPSAEP